MLLLRSFFRLKELFQVKNGLTTSLFFFFLIMPKIWVGRTTLNGEKKRMALRCVGRFLKKLEKLFMDVFYILTTA